MRSGDRRPASWLPRAAVFAFVAILLIPPAGSLGTYVAHAGLGPAPGWAPLRPDPEVPSTGSGAGDWPTYLSNPERTGANLNESVLAPSNASHLRVLWTAPLPGPPEDSPVVSHGAVFVTSWDGNISSYNLSNGDLLWRTSVGTSTFSSCNFRSARGPTATATVENGTVYVLGGSPYLYALNASNGSILWSVSVKVNNPSSGDYNWGSPLIYGGYAYFGLASACGSPGSQGIVEQVNLAGSTHAVVHTFAVVPSGSLNGGVWSTPSIDPAHNVLWVTTGDGAVGTSYSQSVVALNATTLAPIGFWQLPVACCDYDFGAGPTLFHDRTGRALVAALNKDGTVYALNRSNVSSTNWGPVWRDNISWYANTTQGQAAGDFALAPSAFGNGTLYAGGGFARLSNGTEVGGAVWALDPSNGSVRWVSPAPGIVRAGLAFANGLVVDAADLPNNSAAHVEVRDASDGSVLYSLEVGGTINGGPSIADGIILFGNGSWSLSGPGTLTALALPLTVSSSAIAQRGGPAPTVNATATVEGGVPPYRFQWTFGDNGSGAVAPNASHAYARVGTYWVRLTVNDAGGDVVATAQNITLPPINIDILLFAAAPHTVVLGQPLTLVASAAGGYGGLSYAYAGLPAGCSPTNTSLFTCTPTSTGTFAPLVNVSDEFGDSAAAATTLSVVAGTPSPLGVFAFFAIPALVTVGESATLIAFAAGGTGSYNYSYGYLPPGCQSQNTPALSCTPTVAGSYDPTVTVTDGSALGVTAIAALSVTPAAMLPMLQLLGWTAYPDTVALGGNLTLVASADGGDGVYTYTYSDLPSGCSGANRSVIECTPGQLGEFRALVTVVDPLGVSVNGSVNVTVIPAPSSSPVGSPPAGLSWPAILGAAAIAFVIGIVVTWAFYRRGPGRDSAGGPP